MAVLKLHDQLPLRVLVTRESARSIQKSLEEAIELDSGELTLDFSGAEAVTPSFIDELMVILDELLTPSERKIRLLFLNPPTRLSEKFLAIGRRHGLHMTETDRNTWSMAAVQ